MLRRPDEYVICADEKAQLQALGRRHASLPPASGRAARFEFECNGTLAYLAGWEVHHADLFDRVELAVGSCVRAARNWCLAGGVSSRRSG